MLGLNYLEQKKIEHQLDTWTADLLKHNAFPVLLLSLPKQGDGKSVLVWKIPDFTGLQVKALLDAVIPSIPMEEPAEKKKLAVFVWPNPKVLLKDLTTAWDDRGVNDTVEVILQSIEDAFDQVPDQIRPGVLETVKAKILLGIDHLILKSI